MSSIKLLPPLVVNQIAAGEVVERPASVVKELLENAVDAGATRIDVTLEAGGAELVRVADDGRGLAAEDLPLAVTNHATSKIATADDLFRVGTLGFRGEALASIASVSRLTIRSRPRGEDGPLQGGAELLVSGGVTEPVAPAARSPGTTVEARELFFNTPVRRRFLRSPQTELAHSVEALARVALAHPAVHFTLSHGARLVHDLPPCCPIGEEARPAAWRERIAALYGDELAAALVEVASQDGATRLDGFVALPQHSRSHTKLQFLLVNGRAIRDRSLQHALGEAYRGLLLSGRKPIAFLRLSMPAELVDVNVHPMKLEVRFAEAPSVYSQLLGTLRARFLSTDLRAGAGPLAGPETPPAPSRLEAWAERSLSLRFDDPSGAPAPFRPYPDEGPSKFVASGGEPLVLHRFQRGGGGEAAPPRDASAAAPAEDRATPAALAPVERVVGAPRAMQLHQRYLVVETNAGMEVIDQHALHERVLFEQLRGRMLSGPLETQRLLTPEPVDLTPAEAAVVIERAELLRRLGVWVEPFGGATVLVTAYPALLRRFTPAETLRDLAAKLAGGGAGPTERDLCDALLATMACKAAVKYGDSLEPDEIAALLAARPSTENHHHCPHGRPTSLVFSREELDRRLGRL